MKNNRHNGNVDMSEFIYYPRNIGLDSFSVKTSIIQ